MISLVASTCFTAIFLVGLNASESAERFFLYSISPDELFHLIATNAKLTALAFGVAFTGWIVPVIVRTVFE